MPMATEVRYVDGHLISAAPSGWPMLRGDGVDHADLIGERTGYRMQGCSVYWLRREGELWVLGGGTVVDVQEVAALPGDGFDVRHLDRMPDMAHGDVKLGWWQP